jgi:S-DNA-T family DNA segregation ATPase FtsK/SpoIIIE
MDRMSARSAPARRRKPSARRPAPAAARPRLPQLDQRQLDLLGLGLVAAAVFFAFLIYLGWDGGRAGAWAVDALRWLLGGVHYGVPVGLMAAGAIVVLRPILPAVRPFRSGGICLLAGFVLALAAGTLGLGPGGDRAGYWDPEWVRPRGGMAGEALYWATSTLLGGVGAHIVALFLLLAGVLLLTGASIAGVLKATGDSVSTTTRALRDSSAATRAAVARKRPARDELRTLEVGEPRVTRALPEAEPVAWEGEEDPAAFDPFPDEPDTTELTVVAGPEDDPGEPDAEPGEQRLAEDTDEPGVTRSTVAPEDLTPQGRYRSSVTDSPEFEWTRPDPAFLKRSSAEAAKPDTAGQEKTAAQLVEALGHFGVEAKVIGKVAGPHITRYELRLAPGIKVGKVAQLKDDLAYALAASDIRILAPIPGKQAVGVEVPNARRKIVHLGDVYQPPPEDWSPLTVWLG